MNSTLDYHAWQRRRVVLPGQVLQVATKPGVFAYGHDDPATDMLAATALTMHGKRVLSLSCGNGIVGAAAAIAGASHVWLADRQLLAVEATSRTLALQSTVSDLTLALGHGVAAFATVGAPPFSVDAAFVRVVPERVSMLQLLWDALTLLEPGGRLYLAGANDEGVKPAARWLESVCGAVRVDAQRAGHRLVSAARPAQLAMETAIPDEADRVWMSPQTFRHIPVSVGSVAFTLCTRPGVFSWEHVDEASANLLAELARSFPWPPGARVLDLGCGAGLLGTFVALQDPTADVTLVDVDAEAVRCANETLAGTGVTRARAVVSDVASAAGGEFDVVLTNPPFHVGKHTALDVPRQFIRDARAKLRDGGTLWLVANRTLPYESVLHEVFGNVDMVHDGARFKVLTASAI